MRLLDTRTGQFRWVENPRTVRYAILSHVWANLEDDTEYVPEQTYQDALAIQAAAAKDNVPALSRLSDKIRRFCEVAWADGFELGWADSCCIDKASSAELSEAINSMYTWYHYSATCYAFLRDVSAESEEWRDEFYDSKWFRRGWTLQELIASRTLIFVSAEWIVLGSKRGLSSLVQEITKIDRDVLMSKRLVSDTSVASRMSWAAFRETTREEDRAYSLMGLFGISMPVLYGEGAHAFIRLQEEILKKIPDQSIFAWGRIFPPPGSSLEPSRFLLASKYLPPQVPRWSPRALAASPKDFDPGPRSSGLICLSRKEFVEILGVSQYSYQNFSITPHGIQGRFPLIAVSPSGSDSEPSTSSDNVLDLVVLPVATQGTPRHLVALLLTPKDDHSYVVGRAHDKENKYFRGMHIPEDDLRQLVCIWGRLGPPVMSDIYIYQPLFDAFAGHAHVNGERISVGMQRNSQAIVSASSEAVLVSQGYHCVRSDAASGSRDDSAGNAAHPLFFTISNHTEVVSIHLGRCDCKVERMPVAGDTRYKIDRPNLGFLAIRMSSPDGEGVLDSTPCSGSHLTHVDFWERGNGDGVVVRELELEFPSASLTGAGGGPPAPHWPARWECITLTLTLTQLGRDSLVASESTKFWFIGGKYQLSIEIDAREPVSS